MSGQWVSARQDCLGQRWTKQEDKKLIYLDKLILADRELSSGDRLTVFSNGSLVIRSVVSSDEGRYTCTATNRRGLSSASTANIRVIGRLGPVTDHTSQPVSL